MSQARRFDILAGALLIAAIAFVACGGGSSGGGKTPTSAKPATKAATAPSTKAPATALSTTGTATAEAQAPATGLATEPSAATNTPSSAHQTRLDVAMTEFAVAPSVGTAPAGTVTFNVSNDGTIPHDFVVIKTELAADALPVNPASLTVDESQLNVVKRQPPIANGTSAQVMVDLSAGHYVLICNIASHYQAGSRVGFTVQ